MLWSLYDYELDRGNRAGGKYEQSCQAQSAVGLLRRSALKRRKMRINLRAGYAMQAQEPVR
jgi:hypothetical protein